MFKALRMQMDELGLAPDYRVHGLSALVEKVSSVAGARAAQAAPG
jgi:2-haloacid dehalogenase